ncbi:MAG: phosphotriesterase [Chloroflexi bacterium]|jgi:phosphotriesterase-related protein|nr:phosphotriesterase [Chloroflexota bacterium]
MSHIETVCGPIAPAALGATLIHEHILVDFGGASVTGPHRWDRQQVFDHMLPYLSAIRHQGLTTLVDCTPMYLGRDAPLLRRLALQSGLQIITNTGLYKEPYLPPWAFDLSAEELTAVWVSEARDGIGATGIRPGFIKIAVNPGPLVPIQRKIVAAAALTHLQTGLVVASHTGHAIAAHESLDIAAAAGMSLGRYIIVHADAISDLDEHVRLAKRGAWLEYDALGTRPAEEHARLLLAMLERGYGEQLLLSHDAGWYHVGEPNGGEVRPFTFLMDTFVPLLRQYGVDQSTIERLIIINPARALAIGNDRG